MRFQKGQSGNPKGRPKKERALSKAIELELARTELTTDGKRIARKRLMAKHLVEAITTGKLTFIENDKGDVRVEKLRAGEWQDLVMKLLRHLEGEKHEVDTSVTGNLTHHIDGFEQLLERIYGDQSGDPDGLPAADA